jgi:two-component system sensor histidine kinase YesM
MNFKKMSLNKKLMLIAVSAFLPMLLALTYALLSLDSATTAYSRITQSVTYANACVDFRDRMDYSMYLAVIGKKDFETLGKGEITVNGIVTVNPIDYIHRMKAHCVELSSIATVDSNRNQMRRMQNILDSLEDNCIELEYMINGAGTYDENMNYLDKNIYMLTTMVEEGVLDYIRVETTNLNEVRKAQEEQNRTVYGFCIIISIAAVSLLVMGFVA